MAKIKQLKKTQLIKELDSVFSKYIRQKNSHKNMNKCITCGSILPIELLQCGHYYSRKIMSLRWDEKNCHPQCKKCNIYNEGNKPQYALELIKLYGNDILIELNNKSNIIRKFNVIELSGMILYYKNKLKELNGGNNGRHN